MLINARYVVISINEYYYIRSLTTEEQKQQTKPSVGDGTYVLLAVLGSEIKTQLSYGPLGTLLRIIVRRSLLDGHIRQVHV